jgi:hypothetical protein
MLVLKPTPGRGVSTRIFSYSFEAVDCSLTSLGNVLGAKLLLDRANVGRINLCAAMAVNMLLESLSQMSIAAFVLLDVLVL